MTANILAAFQRLVSWLRPSRSLTVLMTELAGLAAIVYGVHGWTSAGAYVVGGAGLVLEAYALERR